VSERSLSSRARKKVEAEIQRAKREHFQKLVQRRMELARNGAAAFREGKHKDAMANYFGYIDVLEKSKEVERDMLQPKHFDAKKDLAELLLLSGVYWDLAKIQDHSKGKLDDRLRHYLDRFVMFSRGMPFQHVSAELVRKYLANGTPRHRKEFKEAHIQLGGGKCFVATAVEEHLPSRTLPDLRRYRDEVLLKHRSGRVLVALYYRIGPWVALRVIQWPVTAQKIVARLVQNLSDALRVK
jgi:hypothetical protein